MIPAAIMGFSENICINSQNLKIKFFFGSVIAVSAIAGRCEIVDLECNKLAENSKKIEEATTFAEHMSVDSITLSVSNLQGCTSLLRHAVSISPKLDIHGLGLKESELANGDLNYSERLKKPNDFISYFPPTRGKKETYSGTGGKKMSFASCWDAKLWGMYGMGRVIRTDEDGTTHYRWIADSVKPPSNLCQGEKVSCVDDPDATGFQHIKDEKAGYFMRNGTAGHDLSQLSPVSKLRVGWITIRTRIKWNSGNERFYVRLVQGYGKNGQINKGESMTFPGITLKKTGEIRDYLLFAYIPELVQPEVAIWQAKKNLTSYSQLVLASGSPAESHDIEISYIHLHKGILAPSSSKFGSSDAQIQEYERFCMPNQTLVSDKKL